MVQFRGDGAAFVYDPGATHGVYLNKRRVEPAGTHVPLRVGDQLRFGESSRTYVLGGPAELMPDEGPSRLDRLKAAALKVRVQAVRVVGGGGVCGHVCGGGGSAMWQCAWAM